ncbi:MAG: tetratricopeptide repeat protein, partial [Acidobacteriota bacterium]
LEQTRRTRDRAAQANLSTVVALGWMLLCHMYWMGGDADALLESSSAAMDAASRAGDRLLIYAGDGFRACAQSWRGEHDAARTSFALAQDTIEKLGGPLVYWDVFRAAEAELALNAGQVEQALTLAGGAIQYAESIGSIFSQGLGHRVAGQALAAQSERGDEAESHFATSLQFFESGDARLEAARTRAAWGILCRDRGDIGRAREHLEKAEIQFRESGLAREAERARVAQLSPP